MDFKIPSFKHDKDLFDFLVDKEADIIHAKKQVFKKGDGILSYSPVTKGLGVGKSSVEELLQKDQIEVSAAINSTNIIDSHRDLHVNGIWDKSISENNFIKHLQEHLMSFDKIIADKSDLNVYTQIVTWKSLGFDFSGKTQLLMFDSIVKRSRNAYMFEQYAKGNVDQHSVGMRYMKLVTCINDEDYPTQYENYEKYAPMAVNIDSLDSKYFWAVLEAKCIEGSAVPLGSNFATPTTSVKEGENIETKQKTTKSAYTDWLTK